MLFRYGPAPSLMESAAFVSTVPDHGHVGTVELYRASNPPPLTLPSVVKVTFITPVDDVTGPGTLFPVKGLPGSSKFVEQLES